MRVWARWFYLVAVISILASGCSSSGSSGAVTVSPTNPTVFVNGEIQFEATGPSSTTAITWAVNGTNGAYGTIDPNLGLYVAPSVVPSGATVTVTATQGSATGSTNVTVESGAALSISPATATVGTGKTLPSLPQSPACLSEP